MFVVMKNTHKGFPCGWFHVNILVRRFNTVFTALHGMQTRSSDENSVCQSVRPSVRHTRGL